MTERLSVNDGALQAMLAARAARGTPLGLDDAVRHAVASTAQESARTWPRGLALPGRGTPSALQLMWLAAAVALMLVLLVGLLLAGARPGPRAGSGILFARAGDLWLADPAGAGEQRAAHVQGRSLTGPMWSPDHRWIAFTTAGQVASGQPPSIYVVRPDGRELRIVAEGIFPVWSPEGGHLAYAFGLACCPADRIAVSALDGSPASVITPPREWRSGGFGPLPVDWSPDGATILACRSVGWCWGRGAIPPQPPNDLFAFSVDGSRSSRLTDTAEAETFASYSPDGSSIAYVAECLDGTDPGGCSSARTGLYVMAADGSHARRILEGDISTPAWSPDGRRIAFSMREEVPGTGARGEIYVIVRDGTGLQQLTDSPEGELWPVWAPDGQAIAFYQRHEPDEMAGFGDVWVVGLDGGAARRVAADAEVGSVSVLDW